jgi:nicotinic acid phosphoribosyltransferase
MADSSNDLAEFLYPTLFQSIGTIGHEMMCAGQSPGSSLADAEYAMMERYVERMGTASLLCDLVDAESVGLENALRVIRSHPELDRVGIRVDSGDIAGQCVRYFEQMKQHGIQPRLIVFEDEVTPESVREVYRIFQERTGEEPTMLFPGAGGYWWKLVHRDTVAAAFKRTSTNGVPNMKFSNSPGKESLPGRLRCYGRKNGIVVADANESIDGHPLFVPLVRQGRIMPADSYEVQAARAEATWDQYDRWELSPQVAAWLHQYRMTRAAETESARQRLAENNR